MTRSVKGALITLVVSVFAGPLCAQGTYTAASCNESDVNAVINGSTHTAVNGDRIVIPAGSCMWASGITVPSGIGITITGTGTPNSTAATQGASSSCSSGTNITISGTTGFNSNPTFGNSPMHLSCMTLQGNGSGIAFTISGSCTSSGCPNLRVDNLTLNNWNITHPNNGYGISAVNDMFGVADHNTINGPVSSPGYEAFIEWGHDSYLGVGGHGDNSYHLSEAYGSANFLFMENNTFNEASCCENETALVGNGGGRVVARFNQFNNGYNTALTWHGTESNGRPRSGRAFEFYNNTYAASVNSTPDTVIGPRGGTGLSWGNTVNKPSGTSLNSFYKADIFRVWGNTGGWGACDGSSAYDTNDGVTYFDGTIASVSGGTITVSGSPGWASNRWTPAGAPYSIHDVTKNTGAEITSNGSNTVHIDLNQGGGTDWTPGVGDHVQILRATVCLDQAGRGAGILYSGDPASPAAPANEALSPLYFWSNTANGGLPGNCQPSGVCSATARIIQNRDFYSENLNQAAQSNPTTPFNGTTAIGVGHGTLANLPTTCTTGVGYWATDQGNWNSSGNGFGQGELFVCTATNTWSLYYTPYSYPHPLITGGSSPPPTPPNPPTNLTATVH